MGAENSKDLPDPDETLDNSATSQKSGAMSTTSRRSGQSRAQTATAAPTKSQSEFFGLELEANGMVNT